MGDLEIGQVADLGRALICWMASTPSMPGMRRISNHVSGATLGGAPATSNVAWMPAVAVTQIVNFPLMFLSGGLFPVESLPSYLQPLVAVSPLTFLNDALKQLMSGAPALYPLWLNFAVMGGWLAVLLVLGVKFWRWE